MTTSRRVIGSGAIAALGALLLVGCANTDGNPPADNAQSNPPLSPAPGETNEPGGEPVGEEDDPTPASVTCENLISTSLVEQYLELGWTVKQQAFYIGEVPMDDGIMCMWGDYDGPPSDNVAMFAWAPLDQATSESLQTTLEEEGWLRKEIDGDIFLTVDPAWAIAVDDEGYGMTYEFTNEWVIYSDVKQQLALINNPSKA